MQHGPQATTRFPAQLATPIVALVLAACASSYEPKPLVPDVGFEEVQARTIDDVTVSVAILTDDQAMQHFGADLAKNGLQALYIKVRNQSNHRLWFVRNAVDPEVDLTREYLLHSLPDAGLVAGFGFVNGSHYATRDEPAVDLGNDPSYFSDGLRLVIGLSRHPRPYHEVRSMRWEQSEAPAAEGQSESAERYVRPVADG